MLHPTDRRAHTTAFVTPVMRHWLECETDHLVAAEGFLSHYLSSLLHMSDAIYVNKMCTVHCIWRQTYGKGPLIQQEISSKGSFICIIPQTG